MKDLALISWSCARLKIYKDSNNLPKLLNKKAEEMLNDTVIQTFDLQFDNVAQRGSREPEQDDESILDFESYNDVMEPSKTESDILASLENIGMDDGFNSEFDTD